jgi:phosphoribosyl 1,2-cyclic phosphate phosphodiesterase
MKIKLLGTGAADGIPAFHGDCRVCRYARDNGGKDIRSRSAAVIDDCLKIDLPPDTLMQMHQSRTNAKNWTGLIFTHSDEDHFAVDQLQYALHPFTDMDHMGFTIYANPTIAKMIWKRYPEWPLEVTTTRSFCPVQHGEFLITPIRAKHGSQGEDAHNIIFERNGKSFLYATDTGIWPEETWLHLRDFKLDALVIECTNGFVANEYDGHLDLKQCVEVVERLRKQGTLNSNSQIFTTHHSHHGGATHAELEEALCSHGIAPGFDGLLIDIS